LEQERRWIKPERCWRETAERFPMIIENLSIVLWTQNFPSNTETLFMTPLVDLWQVSLESLA
jgi:hypothetical protein